MDGRSWWGPRHFHIVMSRILSPGYRLILCANKPFRPGVKLSVTPERSPTRSLCRRSRRRRCHRCRATKGEDTGETICVEKVGSRTSVNGCKLARKTAGTRARSVQKNKKKIKSPDEWYNRFLFTIVRKKKTMDIASRSFFISSGLARLVIINSIDQFVRSSGEGGCEI